jgi:hypothetical protein
MPASDKYSNRKMTSYRFIDRPVAVARSLYDEAIQGVIERNIQLPGLRAIYRFGNITAPGISDLDLLFVFENGASCESNGLEYLPASHRPLFTHGIMALCEDHFHTNNYFTLWSDHELMWGTPSNQTLPKRTSEEEQALRIQTAIEFLIANYIDLIVQRTYGIFKLRALLQHIKGIAYDLEYLSDIDCALTSPVNQLREWIRNWFTDMPGDSELSKWIDSFITNYNDYTRDKLSIHPVYLPEMSEYTVAKNMSLHNGKSLRYWHTGIRLPYFPPFTDRKFFKLQNRLNTFRFQCPITHQAEPILVNRFRFLQEMKAYNLRHLPNFMTITTSITAKII